MNEEVALELASQKVVQLLISNPQFIEKWQEEVKKILKKQQKKYEDDEGVDLRKPSTSTTTSSAPKPDPAVISIQSQVQELTSTIKYVIETFEDNVDPRNCYLSDDLNPNKITTSVYDIGRIVDRLKNMEGKKKEMREENGKQISGACRRVSTALKQFGKHFQSFPSLEIQSILPIVNRFCRFFYTISHEISRFSEGFHSKNRNLLKQIGSTVEESANEFNVKVAAAIEKIIKSLESSRKRQQSRPSSAPKPVATPLLDGPAYGIQTRRQQRLASSIQQVMGSRRVEVEIGNKKFQKTHPAGGIATSIIPLRKGFLIEDNLIKARQRIASARHLKPRDVEKTLNIDKSTTPLEDPDDVILKSARKLTGLVLDDVRKSIKF